MEYQTLPNAPITEALIDLRIRVKSDFDVKQLESLHKSILDRYPEKKGRKQFENKFEFDGSGTQKTTMASQVIGYFFRSADQKQIFQAKIDGFTFNRLKPYETWASFREEAKRLWQFYYEMTSPVITRVAVRYINKFNIPLTSEGLKAYITAAPEVPKDLPQAINSYLTRVVISNPEIEATAIITQAVEQMIEPCPIILDIDVFRFNPDGIAEKEAWILLDKMRDFKNEIFFSSITEKTKELFR